MSILPRTRKRWLQLAGAIVLLAMLGIWTPTRTIEHPADTPWSLLLSQGSAAPASSALSDTLRAMDGSSVALTGFMVPLEQGRTQQRFLLSAHPLGCSFHAPPGLQSVVEIFAVEPVKFTYDPIIVQGTFSIDSTDASMPFRISDGVVDEYRR